MKHYQIRLLGAVLGVAALATTACSGKMNFSGTPQSSSSSAAVAGPVQSDQVPACEVNYPQVILNGNVNSFEFGPSVSIMFGYNQNGLNTGVGGNISVAISKADMDMSMNAVDPMTGITIAGTEQAVDQTGLGLGGNVDFSQYTVGAKWFEATPLAKVTAKGLTQSLAALNTSLNANSSYNWVGRVIQQLDANDIVLNVGSNAGLVAGDTFYIYNVSHVWQGAPCNSAYRLNYHNPSTPVAVVQVAQVGPGNSVATIVSSTANIVLGAEVDVKKLVAGANNQARVLRRTAKLDPITAKAFTVPGVDPNATPFDFQGTMNDQISQLILTSGFALLQ